MDKQKFNKTDFNYCKKLAKIPETFIGKKSKKFPVTNEMKKTRASAVWKIVRNAEWVFCQLEVNGPNYRRRKKRVTGLSLGISEF